MPNIETANTEFIETSGITPTPIAEKGPIEAITSISPQILEDPSKRRLFRFGAGLATAATAASMLSTPAKAEGISEEQEFKNIREEILYTYGFDIESQYGEISLERINQIKEALSIFPRDFAYMIEHTKNPAILNLENTMEDVSLFTPIKVGFVDFSQTDKPDSNGFLDLKEGRIILDSRLPDVKTAFHHEISHMVHAVVGGPLVSSVNYYKGDSWVDISNKTASQNGYARNYGLNSAPDDFATTGEKVLQPAKSQTALYTIAPSSNEEGILKEELVKEAFAIATHGKMDKQYFKDLAAGIVNLEYFDHKKPSEFWRLEGNDKTSIYITDLDKKDAAKHLPALITAVQKPAGSFESPDNVETTEFSTSIGGKRVALEPSPEPDSNTVELVIDDYRQPFFLPEKGTETYVSINTPEVKMEVLVVNNNGTVSFKSGRVSYRGLYSVEKDDFSSDRLAQIYSLSNFEQSVIGGVLAVNAGIASFSALKGGNSVENKLEPKHTRRGFIRSLAGAAAFVGLTGAEYALSKNTPFVRGVTDKIEMIKNLRLNAFKEFCRQPTFTQNWGEKKMVEF